MAKHGMHEHSSPHTGTVSDTEVAPAVAPTAETGPTFDLGASTPADPAGVVAVSTPAGQDNAGGVMPAAGGAQTPVAQPASGSVTKQGSMIVLSNGEPRSKYIQRRWAEGASRGQIVRELKDNFNHEVQYQIVFAATKGKAGGPAPATGQGSTAPGTIATQTPTNPVAEAAPTPAA